jgi:hypothetical protein
MYHDQFSNKTLNKVLLFFASTGGARRRGVVSEVEQGKIEWGIMPRANQY